MESGHNFCNKVINNPCTRGVPIDTAKSENMSHHLSGMIFNTVHGITCGNEEVCRPTPVNVKSEVNFPSNVSDIPCIVNNDDQGGDVLSGKLCNNSESFPALWNIVADDTNPEMEKVGTKRIR